MRYVLGLGSQACVAHQNTGGPIGAVTEGRGTGTPAFDVLGDALSIAVALAEGTVLVLALALVLVLVLVLALVLVLVLGGTTVGLATTLDAATGGDESPLLT